MSRLLIVGIDSASFDLIGPWVRDGKLPNLARYLKKGVYGDLKSVLPSMTPPAWTSFVTGRNPGKHGIFDWTCRKPGSYELEFVNALSRKSESIWKIMSDAGKRVCTVAVPISYPPESINGSMISGIDTPGASGGLADPSTFYPPELYEEVRKAVGPYFISPNLFALENDQYEAMVEAATETVQRKMETALYLYQKEQWDCFMVVIGETDAISHRLWKYHDPKSPFWNGEKDSFRGEDPVLRIYRSLDEYLGKLCDVAADDTTTIMMSDHGHGGNTTKAVYLNRWLQAQKLLAFKAGAESGACLAFLERTLSICFQWAKAAALKYFPPNINKKLLRKTKLVSRVESALRFSNIDWTHTKAYSEETPYFPTIWINLQGREPDGTVKPGTDYEQVRDDVVECLSRWLDPETGQHLVRRVHKREDLYKGPFVEQFPDLIIEWNLDNGYSYLFKNSQQKNGCKPVGRIDEKEKSRSKSGDHRDYGILVVFGKHVGKSKLIQGAELIDLAPTILHLSGLPVPDDMDGRVLTQIFEDDFLINHPVCFVERIAPEASFPSLQQDYSPEEEEAMRERLRGLGYIE
jgi:predicted AlkP superfamily phosphohydrolase/phosphomutase